MKPPLHYAFAVLLVCSSLARADVFIIPEAGNDTISRVSATGGKTTLVGSGLSDPQDVAYDGGGNLYVADAGTGKVLQFPPDGSGVPVQVGDTVAGLSALAFDANGVLHIASSTDRTIRKLNGGTFSTVATLPMGGTPRDFGFAPDGNIFVADSTLNRVREITPAGAQSEFSDEVTAPFGVAFDASGKLHVSDSADGGRIATFNPNGKAHTEVDNLGMIRGLGFDRAGELYYVTSTGSLRKVVGNSSTEVIGSLSDPHLFAVRSAQTSIIAFKGQTLDEPNGAQFATLGSPAIGGGFVAFKGTLTAGVAGVASSNAPGLWRGKTADALELLARKAFPAPGVSGAVFGGFGDPILNENGQVAFHATLTAGVGGVTAANAQGIWTDASGSLTILVRKGDPAPGLDPGAKFAGFRQIVLPDDAGPAFLAKATGPNITSANNLGLWSAETNGTMTLVIRKGDTVTVNGAAKKIASLGLFVPTPLSLGQGRNASADRKFTFLAKFLDGSSAVLLAQPGQAPTVLAFKGETVGATVTATTFKAFGPPCVSDDAAAFGYIGKLTPGLGDVTSASATAVFRDDPARQLDARKTFPAPGTGSAIYASLSDPVTNADNGTAFFGKLTPGIGDATTANANGLWVDTGAGLDLAVRKGDTAPGIRGGNVTFSAFKQFVLPDTGGPVFTASVIGSGITTANNLGIWASDGAGGLELFLRKGDRLTIDGAARTVASFKIFVLLPGVGGQSRHFDSDGNVACHVKCTDGTQAIARFQQP